MTTSPAAVAVILFTRSAGEEALYKRFVSHEPAGRNASVAAQLIEHATSTASQAGVDFVCVDSSQQTGTTFGERLAGAMRQVFGQGYEYLLVMGNDCPQLDESLLRRAIAAVRRTGAVVGPATDGGVYLLGVSRSVFESAAWQTLPWQTPQLGAALLRQLRDQGTAVAVLPTLADVDGEQDLARLLRHSLAPRLRRRLHRLRTPELAPGPARVVRPLLLSVAARPHRGPPAD